MTDNEKCPFGHWCDEFTTNHEGHEGQGYCWTYGKLTSMDVFKECQRDLIDDIGPFCYYCCPYREDGESNCDDPGVSDLVSCELFNEELNIALGGVAAWEYEYFFDHKFAYYRGAPLP